MRVTRAAQRAQQDVEHVEVPEVKESVLKDIEPNTSPAVQTEESLPAKTPAKKGKGKGAKGKKAKAEEKGPVQVVEQAERQAATSNVDEGVDQGSSEENKNDIAQAPNNDEPPKTWRKPAIKRTRRQLAKLEEEEALSKPPGGVTTRDAPDRAVEQAAYEELTKFEPESATKPARRTQRQQAKVDKEQPGEHTIEDAVEGAVEWSEAPVEVKSEAVTQEDGAAITYKILTNAESEPASKPKHLTRRQQAKLEKEQQQSQAKQQPQQPEPIEEELKEIVVEAANIQANEAKDVINPAIAEERMVSQEVVTTEPHQGDEEADAGMPASSRIIEPQVPKAHEVVYILDRTVEARPAIPTDAEFEANPDAQVDGSVSDEITPSVEMASEAGSKMLSAEKPFEASMSTPVKNQGSIRRTSRSQSKSPIRIEQSISAIDRLEENLGSIGKAIPDLDHSNDEISPRRLTESIAPTTAREKTPSKTPAKTPAKAPAHTPAKVASNTSRKTPAKAPVTAKVPTTTKAPAAAKAPLPIRISRVPNAAPKSVKPTVTSLARASSVRTAPSKDARKPSTETADYLASKRRPISLSFPTPPPPPKGRAPTKSTFQLSSDNIAARLRAQKEERLKREAEGVAAPKQRPISIPPTSKSTKPPTLPSFQLPGEATAARLKAQKEERLRRMEGAGGAGKPTARPVSMPPPPKSLKPVTKPSFQLPGEVTAAKLKAQKEERLKRMEEAETTKKAALAAPVRKPIARRARESLIVKGAPGVNIPSPPQFDASQRLTSLVSKSSSVVGPSASRSTSTSSANRNSVLLAEGGKSTVTPVDAAALKVKGKQVFNRDRMEKEAMERERREKEEAAKKARAEAAERGRVASREWAERQRMKMMIG